MAQTLINMLKQLYASEKNDNILRYWR